MAERVEIRPFKTPPRMTGITALYHPDGMDDPVPLPIEMFPLVSIVTSIA